MSDSYYTHATWHVRPGKEEAFVEAWRELGDAFNALDQRPEWGSLLQSLTDPHLFVSFGPWGDVGDIQAMRADPDARAALEKVRSLCVEASPGAYRRVAHVVTPSVSRDK